MIDSLNINTWLYVLFNLYISHSIVPIHFMIETVVNKYKKHNLKFHQKTEKNKSNWWVMETVVFLSPVPDTP